ncbi:DUF5615 family PIN-like protein [Allochromatium humboldtianum]|uniref:DUF5615 family PIN-like protein n=1 Tax=Allochromatium humboldtianum TaxID=504901 RepID=A0A850R9U8_9GAMM|nr:DUF5615 family PIN-like protein [Allochromatium humboldtianum]NVZ07740.1 DUF5615 family PIN-like protein [Allochromatium humboldtianum]
MKLLLDQNISRRIVPSLQAQYPGSSQVALLGLDRASDSAIWDYASVHGYTIVTKDADFEEMTLVRGSPPKVIWLRLGNVSNQMVLETLINHHATIEALIERHDLSCLEILSVNAGM